MKTVKFLKIRSLGGEVYHPTGFSQRFLRKNGIFKKIAISVSFCMIRWNLVFLLINYNRLFPFLQLIFTTLDDLGEMRSCDLSVAVAHYYFHHNIYLFLVLFIAIQIAEYNIFTFWLGGYAASAGGGPLAAGYGGIPGPYKQQNYK